MSRSNTRAGQAPTRSGAHSEYAYTKQPRPPRWTCWECGRVAVAHRKLGQPRFEVVGFARHDELLQHRIERHGFVVPVKGFHKLGPNSGAAP